MDIAIIHQRFNEQISSFICYKVKHADHCHDILQEVYIKIIMNLNKLEKVENIKSYLFKVADNAITDHYRAKSSCGSCELTEHNEQELIAPVVASNDKSLQLADCCMRPFIESLDPIYREALDYTDLQGFTQKQYAEKAGISLSGAKSRVQRARAQLKQRILTCCNYQFDKYGNITGCCAN
jgi:RNA polymerase sigma-70 factor (ECF subfamily)